MSNGIAREFSRQFDRLAARHIYACVFTGLLCLTLRLAVLPKMGIPSPSIHDEFSYLLAADTFAQGRLANPAHPFWIHFETFHVLQQPVYASKYPPGQGLVLALGQLLGHPWIGVWIGMGLLCSAVCWMMQGWLPSRVALFGALLVVVRIGIDSYWMNTYWGGAVAATGGALVLGALPRLSTALTARSAIPFALGTAILMNSRPYEGALVVGPALLYLGAVHIRRRSPVTQPLLVAAAILLVALAWTGFYNYRVTGSVVTMPYQLHEKQYAVATAFLWQKPRPIPAYHHEVMRRFWTGFDRDLYWAAHRAPVVALALKLWILYQFFLGYAPLLLPLIAWPFLWKNHQARLGLLLFTISLVGVLSLKFSFPHYAAPISSLFFVLYMYGLEAVRSWRPGGKPRGALIVNCLALVLVIQFVARVARASSALSQFVAGRAQVIATLQSRPGQDLVLVRYAPDHNVDNEWVYNRANIDGSRIVWAREMGAREDEPLLRYYPDRRAWLLEADAVPPVLTPYPAAPVTTASLRRIR